MISPRISLRFSQSALPLKDSVADYIVASDILEHFPFDQSLSLLREWRRVLKPSGALEIRCPQFGRQMHAYATGTCPAAESASTSLTHRGRNMDGGRGVGVCVCWPDQSG